MRLNRPDLMNLIRAGTRPMAEKRYWKIGLAVWTDEVGIENGHYYAHTADPRQYVRNMQAASADATKIAWRNAEEITEAEYLEGIA